MSAAGLWQVTFTAPAEAMPGLLEALESEVDWPADLDPVSTAVVEDAADAHAQTTRWRAELLLRAEPAGPELRAGLADLARRLGTFLGPPVVVPLPETDWLAAVAAQTRPQRVGRFTLHPTSGAPEPGTIGLAIDAGLAFGSGEHQTTRACLEALDRHRGPRPGRVFDLGCGSGVLGIAAAKRWPTARVVLADNDPVAVRVAAENATQNGLSAARVHAVVSEGWASPRLRGRYDLVFANILADPLVAMAPDLARGLAPGGVAILSGFIERDRARVLAAHAAAGLRHRATLVEAPWCAMVVGRGDATSRKGGRAATAAGRLRQ